MAEDEVVDQSQEQEPDPEEVPEPQAGEAQAVDDDSYTGLQADDFVGDARRLRLVCIDPVTGEDHAVVGEVWQEEGGVLQGTGLASMMLFEPVSKARYQSASLGVDMSPLTVFYARMARSSFLRAEFVEVDDA